VWANKCVLCTAGPLDYSLPASSLVRWTLPPGWLTGGARGPLGDELTERVVGPEQSGGRPEWNAP